MQEIKTENRVSIRQIPDTRPTSILGEHWLEAMLESQGVCVEEAYQRYQKIGGTLSYKDFIYILSAKPSTTNLSKSRMLNQGPDGIVPKYELPGHYAFANLLNLNNSSPEYLMRETGKILSVLGRRTKV